MTNTRNVLFLMSDEHNPRVAGFAGNSIAYTPALDELASQGIVFGANYTPNPVCVPARRGLHTGMFDSNVNTLPANYDAMGTWFHSAGFRAAWFGKQHWDTLYNGWTTTGLECGKESKKRLKAAGIVAPDGSRLIEDARTLPYGASYNEDAICTEQALNFLNSLQGERFFLGVSLVKPHFPFAIQPEFLDLYATAAIPQPQVSQAMLDDLSAAMKLDRDRFGFANLTPEECDYARKVYYGMVSFVDAQVEAIMAKLDVLGLRENTIVVYCSDHGEMLGTKGIWYKNCFYEEAARVPLIISAPGFDAGQVNAPTNLIDLYPTLCSLCGIDAPEDIDGQTLVPLMDGTDSGASRITFSENKRGGIAARMIRTPEFKYCWYADGFEQLYDFVTDPDETINQAKNDLYAGLKADLKAQALAGWNQPGLFDGGE